MAFNKQLWVNDLAANLYDTKEWFKVAKDWSAYVNGSITHVPNGGAGASVTGITNSTSLPVAATRNQFDEITFTNKMLAFGPTYVTNIDAAEASFDTRTATMQEMINALKQALSIEIANNWLTIETGSILETSGSTTRGNIYGNTAIKSLTYNDVLNARRLLSATTKNVDLNSIYMLVDPFMYADLLGMTQFTQANDLGGSVVVSGFVGEIAGIKVIQRASGLAVVDNAGTWEKVAAVDYSDDYDATHYSAALMFDASKVGYAVGTAENGEINVGVESYASGYFTDVLQGHTRVGSAPAYKVASNIQKGVVSIIETK